MPRHENPFTTFSASRSRTLSGTFEKKFSASPSYDNCCHLLQMIFLRAFHDDFASEAKNEKKERSDGVNHASTRESIYHFLSF